MIVIQGNLFENGDVKQIQNFQDLIEEKEFDNDQLSDLYGKWSSNVESTLGKNYRLSLTGYPDQKYYIDIERVEENAESPFISEVKIDSDLVQLWDNYQQKTHQAIMGSGNGLQQDCDQGHFLSENDELREMENNFLAVIPKHVNDLKDILESSSDLNSRRAAAYLIQWSDDKNFVKDCLIKTLRQDNDPLVLNNAARALYAVSHVVKLTSEDLLTVLNLLMGNSVGSINKSLFLILDLLKTSEELKKLLTEQKYQQKLESLSQANQPNLSRPAKDILLATKKAK